MDQPLRTPFLTRLAVRGGPPRIGLLVSASYIGLLSTSSYRPPRLQRARILRTAHGALPLVSLHRHRTRRRPIILNAASARMLRVMYR